MGNDADLRTLTRQLRSGRIDRRRFVQGTAALGVSAAAVSSALRAAPSRAQDAGEIVFWCDFVSNDFANVKAVADGYNAQATGAKVNLVQIPQGEETDVTKLMTAVRGGTGPDIYFLDRFTVAQRAGDGVLQDLSEMGGGDIISNYIPFAQAEAMYNGVVYALPFDTDARALYYNLSMLNEAGIDATVLDPANGPATWDQVAEIANQLNTLDANQNYTRVGFVPYLNQGWHYTYGFSWGGSFFDWAGCQVTPDDPPIVEAFTWVQNYCVALDAVKLNAFGGPPDLPGFDPAQHPFHVGTVGMQITGDWEIGQMELYAPDTEYGITYIPVPTAGMESSTWAGGWSLTIPQGAKNVEGAWEAIQWMCGEEGGRIYTQQSKHLPTWAALLNEGDLFSERHKFFAELLPTAKSRPPIPVGARYWDELTVAWQKTYLNEGTPADLLKETKDRVNSDLERFCPITEPDTSTVTMPAASPQGSPTT
jgi:multiple sugar transport system substrate-binding protein